MLLYFWGFLGFILFQFFGWFRELGKYYVFGCFCSYNCAAAYNIEIINDYSVSDRYSLIKQLYNEICKNSDDVTIAPPWQALKEYGGNLTITQFRNNSKICKKEYKLLIPPLVWIVPILQEDNVDKYGKLKKIENTTPKSDECVLIRKRPLPRKTTTLMDSMGLVCEKK